VERSPHSQPRPFKQNACDDLAVSLCELLADLDVMQIVLQIAAVEEGEGGGAREDCGR